MSAADRAVCWDISEQLPHYLLLRLFYDRNENVTKLNDNRMTDYFANKSDNCNLVVVDSLSLFNREISFR